MRSRSVSNQAAARCFAPASAASSVMLRSVGNRPVWRSASPSTMRGGERDIERAQARPHRDRAGARRRPACTAVGHAGALAAEQQRVVRREGEVGDSGIAPCVVSRTRRPRRRAREMRPRKRGASSAAPVEIIHAGALQAAVVEHEAAGLDDVDGDAEAGAEAQQRAGVLRNVGLVEGKTHGAVQRSRGIAFCKRPANQSALRSPGSSGRLCGRMSHSREASDATVYSGAPAGFARRASAPMGRLRAG